MSPLGMATIAAVSIFAIVKLVDKFTTSLEESREALANLKEEYSNNENELKTLNDELQTTIDRINELQGKDSLTFTEAEELENLQRQNAELQQKIALLETIQKQKKKEINEKFVQTMDKDLGSLEYALVTPDGKPHVASLFFEHQQIEYKIMRLNELQKEMRYASDEGKKMLKKEIGEIEKYLVYYNLYYNYYNVYYRLGGTS